MIRLRPLLCAALVCLTAYRSSAFNFSISKLQGVTLQPATSLQFGPDSRLYVAQVNGQILALTVQRIGPNNYQVTATETINLVRDIPNYNDDGARNVSLTTRQCTGILVVGTATNPIIYATSSDPRIGGGSGGENDLNLDTNSGIISRLTRNGGAWSKVDLVRGLPRSEENHATNGLQLDAASNTLYVAQGGNTNAGAPSVGFAFACETALSAAVLSVDLNAMNQMPVKTDLYGQSYVYNLPTLDDPNPARGRNPDGSNVNDPFGGNDGLNQAKLVIGGPVQVYASGFRNPYDLVLTRSPGREGRLYAFDNGANPGWGGYPTNEGPAGNVTNQYPEGEPGFVNNKDNLHFITGAGFYGGHPNPVRANPAGAGWFHYDNTQPDGFQKIYSLTPTSDWPSVPVSLADPRQGDYLQPGVDDGALLTYSASTNGLTEYVANNFSGAMQGNLIAASYDGTILRIALNAAGTAVTNGVEPLAKGFGNLPLDVTAPDPGHGAPFLGTIWVSHYAPAKISVLEPEDFDSPGSTTCTGINSFSVDEDGDGYSNADEIANGSDPCSSAILPADADGDHVSDLMDPDDDNDGRPDTQDPFPIDALDGRNLPLPLHYELFNETGIGFFGVGMTGLMMNAGEDYLQRMTNDNIVAGGTAGLFTVSQAGAGSPRGSLNTQTDAYHFAFNSDQFTPPYIIASRLAGPFFAGTPTGAQTQGIYLGTGDQDHYVSVALHANNGAGGVEVVYEEGGAVLVQQMYPLPALSALTTADLFFTVDPQAGTVQPGYRTPDDNGIVPVGNPLVLSGETLAAVMGARPLAIGLFANTGGGSTPTFSATWDYFDIALVAQSTAKALFTINPPTTDMATASTYTKGGFQIKNLSTGGQQIQHVTLDISTAILPDLVFDTNGTAGDPDYKPFEPNSASSGVNVHGGIMSRPHNGTDSDDGYDQLDIAFDSFPVNGTFAFSIDVDPNSVKGAAAPGPNDAASVSGLELIGSTATVYFNDGTVHRTRLGRLEGSVVGSYGWLRSDKPPKPGLTVPGKTSPFQTGQPQTVRVSGPAGCHVSLVTIEAALYLSGVPGGGYHVAPYDANTAIKVTEASGIIPTEGFIDMVVTPTKSNADGGINYVTATLSDDDGDKGPVSDPLTIWYDPSFAGGDTQPPTAPSNLATSNITPRSVALTWTASTDNVGVTGYDVLRNGKLVTTTPRLGFTDIGLDPGVAYNYTVVARDAANNSASATTSATTVANGTPILRINAGGSSYVDSGGNTWTNDSGYYNTGTVFTTTNMVNNSPDSYIFKSERYDPATAPEMIYSLPVGNGQYEVQLFFAEVYGSTAGPGQRVFDVTLENQVALQNVDIYSQAGGANTALVVFANATVTDGILNIGFVHKVQNPKVCAIKVIRLTSNDTEAPSSPTNLHASQVSATTATLAWNAATDNNGVTSYVILRDGVVLQTVAALTFNDSGLTAATTYHYAVRAADAAGNLSPPATLDVTTSAAPADNQPPTPPGTIVFSNVTTSAVTLTWPAATDNVAVTAYRVSRDGTTVTTTSGTSFTNSGLSAGTTYNYSVVALDAAGNVSTASTGTIATNTAGSLPSVRINAGGSTYTDGAGHLWSADTGFNTGKTSTSTATITGTTDQTLFRTERYDEPSGNELAYAINVPNGAYLVRLYFAETYANAQGAGLRVFDIDLQGVRTFEDVDVFAQAGGGYRALVLQAPATATNGQIKIRFYHQVQNPKVNAIEIIPAVADTEAPTAPTGLTASDVQSNHVTLVWNASSDNVGVSAYRVLRNGVQLTEVAALTFNDTSVSPSSSYTYQVIAVDAAGNTSTPAALVVGTPAPSDTTPPTTPGNLTASNLTYNSVTLSWSAATDAIGVTGYRVVRNGTPLGDVAVLTFTDSGLNPGTAYQYQVSAFDAAGNVSAPAVLPVTTPVQVDTLPPTAPKDLAVTATTQTSIALRWTAATDDVGVTGYRVSRNGTSVGTTSSTTFTDAGLTASTSYLYVVSALDAAGHSTDSAPLSAATDSGLAIRVNAGGNAYVDNAGHTWSKDTGYNTGKTASSTNVVSGTADQPLFAVERYDEPSGNELAYTFAVPNGTYTVRLYFAETYAGAQGPGLRVFDIDFQNVRTFEDVDIFAQAGGGSKALTLETSTIVTGGQIKIRFLHQVQNPKVNAIEILQQSVGN